MTESDVVVIRSAANTTIRRLAKLRDNRRRKQSGTFLVDGWRESGRAARAGFMLQNLFVPQSTLDGARDLPAFLHSRGVIGDDLGLAIELFNKAKSAGKLIGVADDLISRIAYGKSIRGVVAEFTASNRGLSDLRLPESPFVMVLDSLEKPGNVGAVFRCADAAGVDAILITGEGCDLFNPNVIRGSLGAVFNIPWATASESDAARFLTEYGIRILAARVESSQEYWQANLCRPLAIVVGNEANGLGTRWQQTPSKTAAGEDAEVRDIVGLRIPMLGESDSLNVSVSAALLAYEVARQNQLGG